MKILNIFLLNKEARLFDTRAFILKTFVAVLLGSLVGKAIPYISKDMISVLFGMMLTIEPVNMTGIRSGFKQMEASIIGAIITGIILALFGYTPLTTAVSITATLYVSLLIDWKQFSVVAVFTSIYMTQYVQFDTLGIPSEFETFKLRITALMTGVAIALFVNYIFSVMAYRHMLEKRIYHLINDLDQKMRDIYRMLEQKNDKEAVKIMEQFSGLVNNINWISDTILDYKKDQLLKKSKSNKVKLERILEMGTLIREMAHLNYDICYKLSKGNDVYKKADFIESYKYLLKRTFGLKEKLDRIIHNKDIGNEVIKCEGDMSNEHLKLLNEAIKKIDSLMMSYSTGGTL